MGPLGPGWFILINQFAPSTGGSETVAERQLIQAQAEDEEIIKVITAFLTNPWRI